jgi:hypothetical protein
LGVSEAREWLRYIINDWQSSGLINARSGDALTVMLGQDVSFTGINRDIPNLISNPFNVAPCATGTTRCKSWMNFGAFTAPAAGQFGSVKKNSFNGPNFVTFDTALARKFNFNERVNLQFRAEYFNLLNHTNFADPAVSLANSSTFGRITTANDPRIAQLSLKLLF